MDEHPNVTLLNQEPRDLKFANTRPADAATLIVLDNAGRTPRLLMGKRSMKLKFMPGMFVFPGGRAEADDVKVPLHARLRPEVERQLQCGVTRPSAARAQRLALAAIRETFEETGLVIGAAGTTGPIASDRIWSDYLATGHLPDLSKLTYLARAITPPRRPRRFDTRFFVVDAEAVVHSVGDVVGPDAELTELAWLTLQETRSQPLPAITRAILNELESALAEGTLGKSGAIPFYRQKNRRFVRALL